MLCMKKVLFTWAETQRTGKKERKKETRYRDHENDTFTQMHSQFQYNT